ncbi:MAG: double-strand break repair helicase AddA [Devosia sp.]|nr:double-strand break repair helicase AddA [Devosia sp.]
MSRRLLNPMPDAIIANQRAASDPGRSVWVRANAGSGKTYVLTARVLRLLLGGARPEEILCLTYTKAAAAEMRGRVAQRLGQWALADEARLVADLVALGGVAPTPAMQLRARSLFAHALETPGGLRIQTIHAFCESVLHRFPGEAGVPFDFTVLEEHERDGMLLAARESVIAAGLRGSGAAHAVETLFGLMSDFQIEMAITEALNQQRTLRRVLAAPERARRDLRRAIGPVGTIEAVYEEISRGYGLSRSDHAAIFSHVRPDPDGNDFVDKLGRIAPERPEAAALLDAYLTQEGTARQRLLKKSVAAFVPDVAERLADEAARLESLSRDLVAAELVARSEALLEIVGAIAGHYERAKRARSLLDFDDLIESLARLLNDEARGSWVRYKLDAGLSHILVDEGQDTNPEQWRVIGALIDDFFFGDSAADRPRTLFAVGDQKQSIFSFQGAQPEIFVDAGRRFAFSARAAHFEVRHVPLQHSFRTLPNILEAVDQVFGRADLRAGALEEDGMVHRSARAEPGGTVTLWPPTRELAEESDAENWPTEPPAVVTQSAQRRLAERIAREIRQWIEMRRPLGPRGRAVVADDVLILVQVRSVLFHEIIRALIRAGIPTPGADRLAVTSHIGVLDLMALGDVLSNPADDLQLAALLRSPLFEVSEDDLAAVAYGRPKGEWLWRALERAEIASVQAASTQLRAWRNRLDFERPFNLFADVLYAGGGLRRMRGRFGSEIDDVVAEFLDLALHYEQSEQPSLLGFLAELRGREVTIKRELAEGGAGVRVMTVHGAKGLEAPIVILADAASTEKGRDRRSVYLRAEPPLFVHAGSLAAHVPATLEHRQAAEAAQQAEYWRKLYVAMTRAEDELYVTGYLTKQGRAEGSWYEAVAQGLAPSSETVSDAGGEVTAICYPARRPAPTPLQQGAAEALTRPAGLELPPLPPHRPRQIIRPSTLREHADPGLALASRVEQSLDPETARQTGTALHALLQHLGRVAEEDRRQVAARALEVLLPGAPDQHPVLAGKALSILSRPELAPLFGPQSRAEVPFLVEALRHGQPVTLAGRLDRVVMAPEGVLIVDFKSDAAPALVPEQVRPAYLAQLALYAFAARQVFPGQRIETAILWTSLESLLKLPDAALAEAARGFTIR